jgi:hypothetical protein
MRYIKKLALYSKSPMDDKFSVLQDQARIVTNSSSTMQLPTGPKASRPTGTSIVDGTIRYNSELNEFEVYNSALYNAGQSQNQWEILRTIRQANITPQNLGYGNYADVYFGPLAYDVDLNKPQNVLVFVDNVYQIPTTNYTLVKNPTAATATTTILASSTLTLYLNTLTNIDVGESGVWRTLVPISGVQAGTTITSITTTFSIPNNGYPVGISLPASLSQGTRITVQYGAYPGSGSTTYIQFTGPVPAKPVFSLLGFDGYFPAGRSGTSFEP